MPLMGVKAQTLGELEKELNKKQQELNENQQQQNQNQTEINNTQQKINNIYSQMANITTEIDNKTKEKVYDIVKDHDIVQGMKNFHSAPVGYQYQIFFTIEVDGNLTTFESHKIANHLEKEITKKIPEIFLTVIHVDPIHINNKKK